MKAKQIDNTNAVKGTRRRSQIEFELALKKAEEILDRSEKATDILKRRGYLESLRPEDVRGVYGVYGAEWRSEAGLISGSLRSNE